MAFVWVGEEEEKDSIPSGNDLYVFASAQDRVVLESTTKRGLTRTTRLFIPLLPPSKMGLFHLPSRTVVT